MRIRNQIAASLIGLLMVSGVVIAGGDANQNSYVSVLSPGSVASTNAAVDVSAYKGNGTIVVAWGTADAASATGTVTVTTSATSGGVYTTVTNGAGVAGVLTSTGITTNEIDEFAIDLARFNKYIKLVYAPNATSTNSVGAILVAPMKSQ